MDYISIWKLFTYLIVGDWSHSGKEFISIIPKLNSYFMLVVFGVPAIFLGHYLLIGPKKFSHDGEQILYYNILARTIHWLAAVFFSLLVFTGLIIVFGKAFGGSSFVRFCRYIHLLSACGFGIMVLPMFLVWVKDMLPASYDIQWFFILGGYLSKKKRPIPAGKYNAGQKMWFWLATLGGGVMLYTGFYLYSFEASLKDIRFFAIVHNILGLAIVALFFTHLYMSIFAIKGALNSMFSGYKSVDEISILHSRYYERLKKLCSRSE